MSITISIYKVSVPAIIAVFCTILLETINVLFVGHLNNTAMVAGVGLGNIFVNMFCQAVILGMNNTICIFVSQSVGAGNMRNCGIILNRGRITIFFVFIPTAILLCFVENILLLLNMDAESAHYSQLYCYWMIPACFFYS